jgi:hypothetical protein
MSSTHNLRQKSRKAVNFSVESTFREETVTIDLIDPVLAILRNAFFLRQSQPVDIIRLFMRNLSER